MYFWSLFFRTQALIRHIQLYRKYGAIARDPSLRGPLSGKGREQAIRTVQNGRSAAARKEVAAPRTRVSRLTRKQIPFHTPTRDRWRATSLLPLQAGLA